MTTIISPHSFHIPVMGLSYTIDSPVKVSRFGISSVVSIVEDHLIEMMRKHYYPIFGLDYLPIPVTEKDYRAKRITDYLNLMQHIVQQQIAIMKSSAIEKGSEIVKYFEMLPDYSELKKEFIRFIDLKDQEEKKRLEHYLKSQVVPGRIDVNIMTKVDRDTFDNAGNLELDCSDAVAALRGYANSELKNTSVVFSAGLNPRLYNYLEGLHGFSPNENGNFEKKVIVKVSDYRSALIQGKYLAKRGIWVSEFRIESGLNCGGHAFATDGYLLGPILEEFKTKRVELKHAMLEIFKAAYELKHDILLGFEPEFAITVQGGIGTHQEDLFLRTHYGISSTGWGTPFLLVPEATTVDKDTLDILCKAGEKDVVLSHSSPLGVRFHYLKGSSGEFERVQRVKRGKPGSPCTEKHLAFNTEFTKEPVCTASSKYQKLKIANLKSLGLSEQELERELDLVYAKECLCVGLSNSAAMICGEDFVKKVRGVTICPGPNIQNFTEVVSLQTMVDHIYGRKNIISNSERPHMFIKELQLYVQYIKEQVVSNIDYSSKRRKFLETFVENLKNGISYYFELLPDRIISDVPAFQHFLRVYENELKQIELEIVSQFQMNEVEFSK